MTSTPGRRAWGAVWPFLPGGLVAAGLYGLTLARGGRFLHDERFLVMQALDPTALDRYPVPVLLSLHTQPPMMNALYWLTDDAPALLGWGVALAMLATVLLVVDTLRAARLPAGWAAVGGALYALLPATVLYALFPYSTTVTALGAMVAVWGVARVPSWHGWGIALSAVGMAGLFLTRASFAWWVVAAWLAALAVLAWRDRSPRARRPVALAALGLCAAGVVAVQGHYWTAFGVPTLSSWSGENLSNALITVGLSDETKARLAESDACFAQLVAAGAWAPVEAYPACIDPAEPVKSGTPVLDQASRGGPAGGLNYNSGARLALADDWARFARAAVAAEPSAVLTVLTGTDEREGSAARFLGRSDVYFETLDIPKATAPAVWSALGVWSAVFPFLAWLVVIAGVVGSLGRRVRRGLPTAFWFAVALLVVHAVPSLVGDYGENQRFRAELDAVLVTAAVLAAWAGWRAVRGQTPSEAPSKAATALASPATSSTTAVRP